MENILDSLGLMSTPGNLYPCDFCVRCSPRDSRRSPHHVVGGFAELFYHLFARNFHPLVRRQLGCPLNSALDALLLRHFARFVSRDRAVFVAGLASWRRSATSFAAFQLCSGSSHSTGVISRT